jgi:hypothetical protein
MPDVHGYRIVILGSFLPLFKIKAVRTVLYRTDDTRDDPCPPASYALHRFVWVNMSKAGREMGPEIRASSSGTHADARRRRSMLLLLKMDISLLYVLLTGAEQVPGSHGGVSVTSERRA